MKYIKPKFWQKNYFNFFSFILLPISFLYQLFLFFYKKINVSKEFDIPIVCIGNIYIGGTGKTPLAIELFDILTMMKKKPAIIKKNYKSHLDEINFIKDKGLDIFIGSKRSVTIMNAKKSNHDVIILDDGYQDNSIKKNLNIICFNGRQLTGNNHTLPSGPLRENFSSLKNCQIVVIHGNVNKDFEEKIKNISKDIHIFYTSYEIGNINHLKDKKLLAFAGIGNPENFFNTLESEGLNIKVKIPFPDHYPFSRKEINLLLEKAKNEGLHLITTEKDYFRIKELKLEIDYMPIKTKILDRENFIKIIRPYI